jgi:hypothetical protein
MMRVRCIANRKQDLDAQSQTEIGAYQSAEEPELTVGKSYPVLGLAFRDGHLWFLVNEDSDFGYPYLRHSAFFELEDGHVPADWVLTTQRNNLEAAISILPAPWAQDPSFMERLVDEDEAAAVVYRELQQRAAMRGGE